jgi:CheY-like chemotaxis protein
LQPISNRAQEDARLLRLIRVSFVASHGIYGAPRVFLDLREAAETCSNHRVAGLMRQANLRALSAKMDTISNSGDELEKLSGALQLSHTTFVTVTAKPKPSVRVLFVDDDAATREGYTAYLESLDFDVMLAATGRQALALASTWSPNVIVLDLALPDIDGWEVARRLKSTPPTATIPIIALTAADLPHERVSSMRAGCDRHLSKPCKPADLLDAIQRSISEVT